MKEDYEFPVETFSPGEPESDEEKAAYDRMAGSVNASAMLQRIYDNVRAIQDIGGNVIGWQMDTTEYAALEAYLYPQQERKR